MAASEEKFSELMKRKGPKITARNQLYQLKFSRETEPAGWMDGWIGRLTDEWMGGWIGRLTDEWMGE